LLSFDPTNELPQIERNLSEPDLPINSIIQSFDSIKIQSGVHHARLRIIGLSKQSGFLRLRAVTSEQQTVLFPMRNGSGAKIAFAIREKWIIRIRRWTN